MKYSLPSARKVKERLMFKLLAILFAWLFSRMVAVTAVQPQRGLLGWQESIVPFRVIVGSEATFREPVFVAPFDCEVGEVSLINSTLVSGAATNFVALNLIDGGPEGAGTDEIANLDFDAALDFIVGKVLLFDNIIGASAERFLTQGDILELEAEENGTGDATDMPSFLVRVIYRAANLGS